MKTIEHKFINDLIELEQNKIFAGRSIIGNNRLLVVGTFNPSENIISKPNNAEWFYGRKANNLWKYIPEVINKKTLKESDKAEWVKFCYHNKMVIIDLIKSFKATEKLKSFSDKELEHKINIKGSQPIFFDSNKAFIESTFDFVIFTRKTWGNDIRSLHSAKKNLIDQLLAAKTIQNENQIILCPAPWGNFKNRAKEWEAKLQFIKNK